MRKFLTAMMLLAVIQITTVSLADTSSVQQPWRAAVIFNRSGDTFTYSGTTYSPIVAASLITGASTTPIPIATQPNVSAEVWLARDGQLVGLWYSQSAHKYGRILNGGAYATAINDDGTISQLVSSTTPEVGTPPQPAMVRSIADWSSPEPSTLASLTDLSAVIVVGRVVGILRVAHTPENAPYEMQHTVFPVAVESYLKKDTPAPPHVLKVWQEGGSLAWSSSDGSGRTGRGFAIMQDPLLHVGDRYCLFVRRQADPGGVFAKAGYVTGSANGITGRQAELDEYLETSHTVGKYLLRGGKVYEAGVADPNAGQIALQSPIPDTIGLSEKVLIAAIRSQIAGSKIGSH